MTFEKPKLLDLVSSGSSIIVVPARRAYIAQLMNEINNSPLPVVAYSMSDEKTAQQALKFMENALRLRVASVLVVYPQHCVGWRLMVDRVIWIGPTHAGHANGQYAQAMSRGDMPWGEPAKLVYTEAEAGLE